MRYPYLVMLSALALAVVACGSPEQPPVKPPEPKATAPATLPVPATQPTTAPAEPAKTVEVKTESPKTPATAPAPVPPPAPSAPPAPAVVAKPASKVPAVVETIILAASQGQVTLPHLTHAKAFPCATCHGDGTPGRYELTKESAHALCRDCHKAKGAGPTTCTGCHQN